MGNSRDNVLISLGAAVLGVLGEASSTGLLIRNADAATTRQAIHRREEENGPDRALLLVPPREEPILFAGHSSHSSHSSHYSGGGGRSSYRSYEPSDEPSYERNPAPAPPPPPPHHPKPAVVSFVAVPGGRIFVDGKDQGHDSTKPLKLSAGPHTVRVENRFVGRTSTNVNLSEGQTGVVNIKW